MVFKQQLSELRLIMSLGFAPFAACRNRRALQAQRKYDDLSHECEMEYEGGASAGTLQVIAHAANRVQLLSTPDQHVKRRGPRAKVIKCYMHTEHT